MKAKAIIEVVIVFSLTLFLVALVGISPIGEWERQVTDRFFIEYALMIAVPLFILLVTRRNLAAYGLTLRPFRYHLNIAAIAFIPVVIGIFPAAFVDYTTLSGSLIMAAVQIVVLFAVAWLLRRKPTMNESGMLIGAIILIGRFNLTQQPTLGNAISAFIFYIFFLGFGEEFLFRGYIQSRLNAAFGRPFQFFGVNWGWGIIIMAILFGVMHFLNLGSLAIGNWQLEPWWGLWTFFGGLVFGFVREKTGSIAAPTILHGLPDAINHAFLGT